jgi:hypothetical protein
MGKAKKQRHKIKDRIKKMEYDEKHSESNHDFDSKKKIRKRDKRFRKLHEYR